MAWSISHELEQFTAAAGEFLRADPARNTITLTVIESLRAAGARVDGGDGPIFGWWRPAGDQGRNGAAAGAFLHTPPFPLLLSNAPAQAARELPSALAEAGRTVPGVNASEPVASQFATAWRRHCGGTSAVDKHMRLYRLAGLVPPEPAPEGRPRIAGPQDRDLLIEWLRAFGEETADQGASDGPRQIDERIGYGGLTVWESGGELVSFAGLSHAVAGMVRVGPVYTPPAQRSRGYAGAVTAAVTATAVDAGIPEILLFTDLANPTSNALYQRIGYRSVEDRVLLAFSS